LVQVLVSGLGHGLGGAVLGVAVLLYCLGPRNFWADIFACTNSLTQGDTALASENLKKAFGVAGTSDEQGLHRQFLSRIFVVANSRVFAVVFWFTLLGPVGAVLYRVLVLSERSFGELAKKAQLGLDWAPVRVFTLFFALAGHFMKAFTCWRAQATQGLDSNQAMLSDCGLAALDIADDKHLATDGSVERSAVALLDRVFIITLAVVAAVSLV